MADDQYSCMKQLNMHNKKFLYSEEDEEASPIILGPWALSRASMLASHRQGDAPESSCNPAKIHVVPSVWPNNPTS